MLIAKNLFASSRLTVNSLASQTPTGSIVGRATDAAHAAVAGAAVKVRNVNINLTRTVESQADGEFTISNLPPGNPCAGFDNCTPPETKPGIRCSRPVLEWQTLDIDFTSPRFDAAETARQQGIDLYGEVADRIVAAMEFQAQYLPPNGTKAPENLEFNLHPTWEIAFNQFHNRLKKDLPKIRGNSGEPAYRREPPHGMGDVDARGHRIRRPPAAEAVVLQWWDFVMRLATICFLVGFAAQAQTPSKQAEVDKIFAAYNTHTPGCAVGVAVNGSPILKAGYGMADLERNVPITPDTVFESGSVAKQFTAMVLMLAAQQGKISLDDPMRKYLPELQDFGAPARTQLRPRNQLQLHQHRV